jgi:ribosome-associated toxin RatA of RatAB toxin-antitoxin module
MIMQEGCKGLLYMVLHARVVLDLCEHLEQEISFEQVEGDFDSFQGKWLFEQLGNHHTLLKYTVESKMRKDTFLSEAIMEEVCIICISLLVVTTMALDFVKCICSRPIPVIHLFLEKTFCLTFA